MRSNAETSSPNTDQSLSYFKNNMAEIYNELKNSWRRNKNFDVGGYCVKVSKENEEDFRACLGMARLAYEELKT